MFVLQTNVEQTRLHKRYHKEPEGQDGDIVNFEEGLSQAWRQQRSGMPGHDVPLAEFYFLSLVSARTDFSSGGSSAVVCAGIMRHARACAHKDALGTFQVHASSKFKLGGSLSKRVKSVRIKYKTGKSRHLATG